MTKNYIITVSTIDDDANASPVVLYQQTVEKFNLAAVIALAFDLSFAELNEKQFPDMAPALNSNFQQRMIFDHDIYAIFASSPGSLVYANNPKCCPIT